MKILTGKDIREADLATMREEGISSLDLMERAAEALTAEICRSVSPDYSVAVFCGKGNNGGDGYAVARLLSGKFRDITVVSLFPAGEMTPECRTNSGRLPSCMKIFRFPVQKEKIFFQKKKILIVDAMLGTGVSGLPREPVASAADFINECRESLRKDPETDDVKVFSIDLPSGLPTGASSAGQGILAVVADRTLTIEFPKLSLLLPDTGKYAGRISVVPIGLSRKFIGDCKSDCEYVEPGMAERILPERNTFSHKGMAGHALIVAGSSGMTGAAILATGAALKSGCGLVTAHIPSGERLAMHISNPSALVSPDRSPYFSELPPDMSRYTAAGVGPGLGKSPGTAEALRRLMTAGLPMVLDADALNIMAAKPELLGMIPPGSVLTPHLGELRRLLESYGKGKSWKDDTEKIGLVREFAAGTGAVVVVKGAHTMICTPSGRLKFNSTGNPGMAKGGSGDVLTGLLTGLLARGLSPEDAAVAAVYFHGAAGDRAAASLGEESVNASDILSRIRL